MFFQKVLKGISGLTTDQANATFSAGIICNWWRNVRTITPVQVTEKLTERNLRWHLNHYDDPDPLASSTPFRDHTPFISTTAGVVERDAFARRNIVRDPFFTAVSFATNNFRTHGHVFYAYVFTLGRQALEFSEFAEEIRELNIYRHYLPIHSEGEIAAKIEIRGLQIERWEEYDGASVIADWLNGITPRPLLTSDNLAYAPPEDYSNVRGTVTR